MIIDSYRYAAPAGVTLVQDDFGNTGAGAPGATFDATLSGASTTGRSLLLAACSDATISTPSGWTQLVAAVNINGLYLYSKVSTGETSVTLTPSAAAASAWWIAEYAGLDLTVLGSAHTEGGFGGTRSTGTTGSTTGATDGLAVAAIGYTQINGGTNTVASFTNSFAEIAETITSRSGGGINNIGLTVAVRTPAADGTFETTASFAGAANGSGGIVAVFKKT